MHHQPIHKAFTTPMTNQTEMATTHTFAADDAGTPPPTLPQEVPAQPSVPQPEPSAPEIKPPPSENPVPVREPPQTNPPVAMAAQGT